MSANTDRLNDIDRALRQSAKRLLERPVNARGPWEMPDKYLKQFLAKRTQRDG